MPGAKKLLAIVIILLISVLVLNAQEKKESVLDSKLKEVKGNVQRIVITSDSKQTVLEGKDAQELFDKFKNTSGAKKLVWITEDGDAVNAGSKAMRIFVGSEGESDTAMTKNVRVEKVDGDLIVTVESGKGGESEVKVFKGEDAEKFLQDEKQGGKVNVKVMKPGGKKQMIWMSTDVDTGKAGGKKEIEKKLPWINPPGKQK